MFTAMFELLQRIMNALTNPPTPPPVGDEDYEVQFLDLVNAERSSRRLKPFTLDNKISQCALLHAQDNAKMGGEPTHVGSDGSSLFTRLDRIGVTNAYMGEVVDIAHDAESAFHLFMSDKPHRDILMSENYTYIGVGETFDYWVVDLSSVAPTPVEVL